VQLALSGFDSGDVTAWEHKIDFPSAEQHVTGHDHGNPTTATDVGIGSPRHRGPVACTEQRELGERTGTAFAAVVEILERATRNCFSRNLRDSQSGNCCLSSGHRWPSSCLLLSTDRLSHANADRQLRAEACASVSGSAISGG